MMKAERLTRLPKDWPGRKLPNPGLPNRQLRRWPCSRSERGWLWQGQQKDVLVLGALMVPFRKSPSDSAGTQRDPAFRGTLGEDQGEVFDAHQNGSQTAPSTRVSAISPSICYINNTDRLGAWKRGASTEHNVHRVGFRTPGAGGTLRSVDYGSGQHTGAVGALIPQNLRHRAQVPGEVDNVLRGSKQ